MLWNQLPEFVMDYSAGTELDLATLRELLATPCRARVLGLEAGSLRCVLG